MRFGTAIVAKLLDAPYALFPAQCDDVAANVGLCSCCSAGGRGKILNLTLTILFLIMATTFVLWSSVFSSLKNAVRIVLYHRRSNY